MEQEITLRDYGRVLWSGRWVLVVAAVGAALVALVVGIARETTHTASSLVYMGLATAAGSGTPVSTPITTPSTAQKILAGDEFVQRAAEATGVDFDRIRDGMSFSVERVPGAVGGNQPTVATIRFTDTDRDTAIAVTNAYAEGVFDFVNENYEKVLGSWQRKVTNGEERIRQIQQTLDGLRARGGQDETVIFSLQQELGTVQFNTDEALLGLAKTEQIERGYIVSKAASATSSTSAGQLLRRVIFGLILGTIIGIVVVFVWRGSPAGRGRE